MDADDTRSISDRDRGRAGWMLGSVLILTFLIRAVHPTQPIVENYVGRQVPTAMVARNLERGSGFLYPQLDTAPFPNYFLVLVRSSTGLPMAAAGRMVSALAMVLAAWGLYELASSRHGKRAALWAVSTFAILPLTIRYGRAFQPDALMLGTVLAGLACWDRGRSGRRWPWMLPGWCLLATGFALKVTSAVLVAPLLLVIARPARTWRVLAGFAAVAPALLWYAWAYTLVEAGAGSHASADNCAIWLGVVNPGTLLSLGTLGQVVRSLIVRAFTPLGVALAVLGLWQAHKRGEASRLWWVWGVCVLGVMALLAQKLHHEYYWLILAPVAAVGAGLCLERLATRKRALAAGLFAVLVLGSFLAVRSTWRTPREWQDLPAAAAAVQSIVPPGLRLASSEALLFASDRRGCRMEWTGPAAQRAAGEWGARQDVQGPLGLLAFYRTQGARYFADLGSRAGDPQRKGLHESVRQRYKVVKDRPEVFIAELVDAELSYHGN
jgi:4-amino-4-deoxy-L-arabinose transferase-like glycosyltransferase